MDMRDWTTTGAYIATGFLLQLRRFKAEFCKLLKAFL